MHLSHLIHISALHFVASLQITAITVFFSDFDELLHSFVWINLNLTALCSLIVYTSSLLILLELIAAVHHYFLGISVFSPD